MKKKSVGRLGELRAQRGVVQGEMAIHLGMTQSAISKLERRANPSLNAIRDYVAALGGELRVLARFPNATIEFAASETEPPPSR